MSANPYFQFSYQDLGRACIAFAADLAQRRQRSGQERTAMVETAVHLLNEAGRRMVPEFYHPGRAEYRANDAEHFATRMRAEAERQQRDARLRVLDLAAGLVLKQGAQHWINARHPDLSESPYMHCLKGDAELSLVLDLLQQIAERDGLAEAR